MGRWLQQKESSKNRTLLVTLIVLEIQNLLRKRTTLIHFNSNTPPLMIDTMVMKNIMNTYPVLILVN